MRTITMIPATKNKYTQELIREKKKRRVAGYARVSTEKDEQYTSYEAQVEYYTAYIKRNPDWEFVHVYTDEGITGTSTKKRDGFKDMIDDALAGKIDLIVTKSVSRFARNTVDSLVTIRELKAHGVEVYFEKENIFTFDDKGELLLTIMSSIAQEEARNISENVTWGHRKRFADGKIMIAYKSFLGYDRGENGMPVINPEEAKTVRLIYKMFLEGKTPYMIASYLDEHKIPTPMGKPKWHTNTVVSILTNEKYKGDALLQKEFTVDYLTKKKKRNEGEVPQYYIENSHPAIIDPAEWEMVQAEFTRRKGLGRTYSGATVFSAKLICGDCGDFYGPKVWHSTDAYRKEIWQCNHKFKGERKCTTPHLVAEQIEEMFLKAYNELLGNRESVITDCVLMLETLRDDSDLRKKIDAAIAKMNETASQVAEGIHENAHVAQAQEEYQKKFDALEKKYKRQKVHVDELQKQLSMRHSRVNQLEFYIDTLRKQDQALEYWDSALWLAIVETGTVHPDGSITFTFKDGTRISASLR